MCLGNNSSTIGRERNHHGTPCTLKEHLGYLLKKAYRFQNMEICYSNLDFVLEEVKKAVKSSCFKPQSMMI